MKNKTFKIGEYCKGGIITVEVKDRIITLIGREWDYSRGQAGAINAKEFTRLEVDAREFRTDERINEFLWDLTSSFYADKVMVWIKDNCPYLMTPY